MFNLKNLGNDFQSDRFFFILNLTPNVAEEEGEESIFRWRIFGRPPLRDMDLNDGKSLSGMKFDEFHEVEMGINNKSSP